MRHTRAVSRGRPPRSAGFWIQAAAYAAALALLAVLVFAGSSLAAKILVFAVGTLAGYGSARVLAAALDGGWRTTAGLGAVWLVSLTACLILAARSGTSVLPLPSRDGPASVDLAYGLLLGFWFVLLRSLVRIPRS